jgi:hypothetical protein
MLVEVRIVLETCGDYDLETINDVFERAASNPGAVDIPIPGADIYCTTRKNRRELMAQVSGVTVHPFEEK